MKMKPLFVLVGLLTGASLAACAPSQVGPDAQAIEEYTEAIALDPQDVDAYVNRGNAYLLIDDYDRAIADYDRAIADYDQAIALDPLNASVRVDRGFTYMYKGDIDRAIADFENALKLSPDAETKESAEFFLEVLGQ